MNRVYVDFLKTDAVGRLRLIASGTAADMRRFGIAPSEGLLLGVYSDDVADDGVPDNLIADGLLRFNHELREWVLEIQPPGIRHESDEVSRP